jgi:hypothetical protein
MRTVSRAVQFLGIAVWVVHLCGSTAGAFNMTGQWLGTIACRTFNGTQRNAPSIGTTMKITHAGQQVAVRIEDGSGVRTYNGQGIDNAGQPLRMRVVLIECRSSTNLNNYSEVVHLNGSSGGRLRGTSILRSQLGDIGTCRWSFQRVSASNPIVAGCP